jgi:hypothetical protein
MNRTFGLVVGLALVFISVTHGQEANAPRAGINVYDGFEEPELSKIWDASRCVPGSVEIQTNVMRAGHGAVKITVRSGDKFEAGINGNSDSERTELGEGSRKLVSRENAAYEYSFSDFIPTNFPTVPTRLVLAQWKQYCPEKGNCSDDSPVVALRYVSGKLFITRQVGRHPETLFETSDDLRGKWTDLRFQIRFTTNDNGRVKVWLNGKQVVDYTGVTAYPEDATTSYPHPSWFYFKMGLYRNVMAEPMTIYIDEYRKRQLQDGEL